MPKGKTSQFTSTPDVPAPQQFCPTCIRPLVYRQTVMGGVHPPERWDYYECRTCGPFVYRHRTRRLRPVLDGRMLEVGSRDSGSGTGDSGSR